MHGSKSGFTLITTLLMITILMVLIAAVGAVVSLKLRASGAERDAYMAQQSALAGLNIALGELQAAVGPDQRVTATASLLEDSSNRYSGGLSVASSRKAWTGVWKSDTVAESGSTPGYDPSDPDQRQFVGWLVSGTDSSGNFILPALDDVQESSLTLSDPQTLFTNSDGTPYLQADKVKLDGVVRTVNGVANPVAERYFAFAVEDEGVKADLSWRELPVSATTAERAQATRLAAAPGPDYEALNEGSSAQGPFTSLIYPLSINDTDFLTDVLVQVRDPADLQTARSAALTAASADWLKDQRAHVTWGSKGVLADMKLGGLKRDLSLAFEMDGETDVSSSEFPALLSQQEGEFVGGSDRLASPHLAAGMRGVSERFLYRDTPSSGSLFSSDIAHSYSSPYYASVRGPNWWSLRDYANLYKRLEGTAGNYELSARSYYPNISAGSSGDSLPAGFGNWNQYTLAEIARSERSGVHRAQSGSNAWNTELNSNGWYIFRPATASYAPVFLGSVCYFSLKVNGSNQLQLVADHVLFLWNPHQVTLTGDSFQVKFDLGLPGRLRFTHTKADGTTIDYGPNDFADFTAERGNVGNITYTLSNYSLEPGEVVAVSPPPGDTGIQSTLGFGSEPTESTGLTVDKFPVPNFDPSGTVTGITWSDVTLAAGDQVTGYYDLGGGRGQGGEVLHNYSYRVNSSLPTQSGDLTQTLAFWVNSSNDSLYDIDIESSGVTLALSDMGSKATGAFAAVAYLAAPADATVPLEIFSQFNPVAVGNNERSFNARVDPNYTFKVRNIDGGLNTLIDEMGFDFPVNIRNAYWGASYLDSGQTHLPLSSIPASPLVSLVQFSHANLSNKNSEPLHAVGNSFSSVLVSPTSIYDTIQDGATSAHQVTPSDASWLMNDALFDRYFLSGIAPDYTISAGGYSLASGASMRATLTSFFSNTPEQAKASPVLSPYIPAGKLVTDIVSELDDQTSGEGYQKMGAYSLINGLFNVNSTSVAAWAALLRANKNMTVANGGSGTPSAGTPFPSSSAPVYTGSDYWSGFSRLTDDQIWDDQGTPADTDDDTGLAAEIVKQVKLRGPFMSLSDFVNHRVGGTNATDVHYMGAIQAAIENAEINRNLSQANADGVTPNYSHSSFAGYFVDPPPLNNRKTTTGVPGDITQANVLLPLAPRLNARSDTFRIRAYGEVRNAASGNVISRAICEAVVQRVPEYFDAQTSSGGNDPWDEPFDTPLSYTDTAAAGTLNAINQKFGRRLKVVGFRWLTPAEI